MSATPTAIRRAIYGKLSGDSTLTTLLGTAATGYSQAIYHQQAPEGSSFPFVILSKSSAIPTETMGTPTALQTDVWLVKAVDRGTTADTAEAAAARIIALLNDATLSISGASNLYLRRQSDVDYPEVANGVMHHHAGALFRLVTA